MYYGDKKELSRSFFVALKCFWEWDVLQFFTGKHLERDRNTGYLTVVKYKPFYKRGYWKICRYLKKKYETLPLNDRESQ
jgi:hypothetical protein